MAGSAVRLVGEDLGAGDGHAERHAHAVLAAGRVLQIVSEREARAGPCCGQTMLDLLRAVQVRLRSRVMLDACETVGPVGGEFRVPGLVGSVEAGEELHALELQIGLRVPAVQIVEPGDPLERGGHRGAVRVREAHGPLTADTLRRVDAAQRLADGSGNLTVLMDRVDPEQPIAHYLAVVVELVELADVAAVPLFQRDGRADPVFRAVRVGPCAHVRQGGLRAEPGRPVDAAARLVPGGGPVRVEPGVGEPGLGGVEREVPVVGGHVRGFKVVNRNLRRGGGDLLNRAVSGGLDLRRVLLSAVRVVAEPVGEAESQIVDDAVLGSIGAVLADALVGDHGARLAGGNNDRALVGFPIVGMVPRIVVAFGGVRGIGVCVGDGPHIADPVPVFRAGLGHAGAGQSDRGEMVLVGAGEQGHAARVALAAAGMPDAERVAGAGRRVHGLGDRTARVHVGGRVPVLLPVQFEVLVAAGGVHVLPGERGGGQAAGLHARLSDTARGLGLGGLYGVLLAVLIGWHAAGRVRRILVVRELVRLVEA